jgi:hypothetical protein
MNFENSALLKGASTRATRTIRIDPRLHTAGPSVGAWQDWTFTVTVKVMMLKNVMNVCHMY